MSTRHQSVQSRHRVEGPRNHYFAFALSIVLTILSFAAALTGVNKMFIAVFILALAVSQAVAQVWFWMHMKDRGHFMPMLFLSFGFFVALTAAVAAEYWMWW